MRPCGWCHVKVLCSQAVVSPHLWGLSPLRPRRRRLPPRHHGVCLGSWLTRDNRRRWRGQKPLIFMRFHEVFHGSQHEIWPKQHNGKVRDVKAQRTYAIKHGEQRTIYACASCGGTFSSTSNTPMARLKTPMSVMAQVLSALTEGVGINAATRLYGVSKNSIYRWQERLSGLKKRSSCSP